MQDQLFIEIDKFDHWAQSQYDIPQDDIGGEWECNYEHWDKICTAFERFILNTDPKLWTKKEKERLLYIIARDNELEDLVSILSEQALIILTEESILVGHRDDKWQLATQLYKLSDKQLALAFLEDLVDDEDEYVNRRSLMELAKLHSDKIEIYANLFWTRNKYGEMDEYQKMAVLHSLEAVNSKQLERYIEMAIDDGRPHLVKYAKGIEGKKN